MVKRGHPIQPARLSNEKNYLPARSCSLAIRSNVSPGDLMRYSRSLPSGGRSRTILYCQDDGGIPLRPELKSTTWPALNLCCRTRFGAECNC
jgi:hypothetical protein